MRQLLVRCSVPLLLASLVVATAAAPLRADPPQEVLITVADDSVCVIRDVKLPCADILKHLREVLRLPAGSLVAFRAEKTSTYETAAAVIELIQKSEYRSKKMGFVNFAEQPKE
jgi:biopolymer transport protein ExbD